MSDRSEQSLLDELAQHYGVAPDYYDVWGRRHVVADETKRAILTAMGLRVETRDAVQRELAAWSEAPWRQPCDPVLVRRIGASPGSWSFRLPVEAAEDRTVRVRWEVRDEEGSLRHEGEAGPDLAPVEIKDIAGRRHARFELPVPTELPMGYYDLRARGLTAAGAVEGRLRLILVPSQCYLPARLSHGGRTWGLALQLYALRSAANWGVGDFRDLSDLVGWAAQDLGAGVIGLNPLHVLKNESPYYISPYSPDSRLFLNPLYLAVEEVPEVRESAQAQAILADPTFRAELDLLRKGEMVDYDRAHRAKMTVLEAAYATFREQHLREESDGRWAPAGERGQAFERFVREQGEPLERFSLFQALAEELRRQDPRVCGWQEWPEAFRDPSSLAVASFRTAQASRVRFYQYLQWVAAEQLRTVAELGRRLGMPIGLYHDLALGSDRSGSDAWASQGAFALGADSGCPPDAFAPDGQNWGLPPMDPHRLRASGYALFVGLLRRNLAFGGALRLDHVMGLFRLFWIPRGFPASAGAYVHYPHEDLLGILALESVRQQAVIVGEDLGTVPDWIKERLAASRVLSYRVLYFERWDDGSWKRPNSYPQQAVAVVTTHDLPTLAGFWAGRDIEIRSALRSGQDQAAVKRALDERQKDKVRLLAALKEEGLLPEDLPEETEPGPLVTPGLCRAVHLFLARSPAAIVLATLEDIVGEVDQANLPGTVESHPNWSRKVSESLEGLKQDARLPLLAGALWTTRSLKARG
ncbi:MAG: 4-alpha-glucanotransferase [Nitrospirota bacterium]